MINSINLIIPSQQLNGGNLMDLPCQTCKNLQLKVLSFTCSASGCERNWNIFEHASNN